MYPIRIALCLSVAAIAGPLCAQEGGQSEAGASERGEPGSDDLHGRIVVTAAGLDRLDVVAGTSVLDGIDLQRNLDSQVGEVLAKIPGVSASSFSPGASRPVLRGFGGERVRVLVDGIGAADASATSDDHAAAVDPLIAERIEVLRGPAVLLYGSQAIGGAVNIITKRIPPAVPDEPVHIDATLGLDTASNRREGGLSLDVPIGSHVAFHVDGSYRNTDDMEIPGYVASPDLRAELFARADEEEAEGHSRETAELREGAMARGTLPNSWTETYTLGTGIAYHSGKSNIGLSFDYYDSDYGIPGLPGVGHVHAHDEHEHDHDHGHDHDHDHEDEHGHEHGDADVAIGMQRYRLALRGELDLGGGFFDSVKTGWSYSDYTHTEFEGGEVGTVFDVESIEGRVELMQARRGNWQGAVGGQFARTDFEAIGAEAFVPANETGSYAVFAVQEIDLEPLQFQFGGRYEHTDVDAEKSIGIARDFDSLSGALGLSYTLAAGLRDDVRVGLNLSRAERAPSAQELFADGAHVATQQYEIGDPSLKTERSWGVEAYLDGTLGPAQFSASIYRNWFDGFIHLAETGEEAAGMSVYAFGQQDAKQFGIEGQVTMPVYDGPGLRLLADLRGDYVRATLDDGSPVPRIPPLSLLGAIEAQSGHFDARAEVEWFDRQERVSPLETPSDGFTFVNLSLTWHPLEGSDNVTLIAQADNIFDVEGRRHASFTKRFVPLSGRNFKLTARASF